MSTRAIIGRLNRNGSVTGVWQWSDGGNSGPILRKYFTDDELVKRLIAEGEIIEIVSPRGDNYKWFIEKGYGLHDIGKCHIIKYHPDDSGDKVFDVKHYKDIPEAYGQDINYLYLYNPYTKKWKTLVNRNYQALKEKCARINPHDMIFEIDAL